MKNFEYAAPTTEAEVLELLSPDSGKTEILAGGTDLVGLMKKMIITPDRVVNIMEVESLKRIEPTPEAIGHNTRGTRSRRATSTACTGPAPPVATMVNCRASRPRSAICVRAAAAMFSLTMS